MFEKFLKFFRKSYVEKKPEMISAMVKWTKQKTRYSLDPLSSYLNALRIQHVSYMSYVPEVKDVRLKFKLEASFTKKDETIKSSWQTLKA